MNSHLQDEKNKTTGMIQSVERACKILELLSSTSHSMGVIEISAKTNINRTTAYGLINTLVSLGYIDKTKKSEFAISSKLFELGNHYPKQQLIVQYAKDVVKDLTPKYKYVNICQVSTTNNVFPLAVFSIRHERSLIRLGEHMPIHATATGKLFYAMLPELRKQIKTPEFHIYTAATISSKETWDQTISTIQKQGYAMEFEEFIENNACMAFPIFDYSSKMMYSLSISDSVTEIAQKQADVVKDGLQCSKTLSRMLGWTME